MNKNNLKLKKLKNFKCIGLLNPNLLVYGIIVILSLSSGCGIVYDENYWMLWNIQNKKSERLYIQGEYEKATKFAKTALTLSEDFGPYHINLETSLNNLACLYEAQGKSAEANPFYKRAMEISIKRQIKSYPHKNKRHSLYIKGRTP